MKLQIFTLFFLLLNLTQIEAQSIRDRFIIGIGSQVGLVNTKATKIGVNKDKYDSLFGIQFGVGVDLRYNIKVINENLSVGIGTNPSIGADYYSFVKSGNTAYGSINIPVEFSLNIGEGATYESDKDFGFAIKTGVDLNIFPLFTDGRELPENYQKFSAFPHVTLAVRFFGRMDPLQEIFIRYNFARQPKAVREGDEIGPAVYLRGGLIYLFGF